MKVERERIAPYIDAEPNKTLALVAEMNMDEPKLPPGATLTYACPMHPEVGERGAGPVSPVRDEAPADRSDADDLQVPDASRGGERPA